MQLVIFNYVNTGAYVTHVILIAVFIVALKRRGR